MNIRPTADIAKETLFGSATERGLICEFLELTCSNNPQPSDIQKAAGKLELAVKTMRIWASSARVISTANDNSNSSISRAEIEQALGRVG